MNERFKGPQLVSVTRRHIRLGAASLTLGGAAFGLIQILQGTVSSFNPRPVVTVLVAVCVALAGSTLGRLRQDLADDRLLSGLLRKWPPPKIADTDPLSMGVFPGTAGDAAGALGPYVPRDVDSAIRGALGAGGWVLVVGPGRAGKSRTGFEAARAVLSDRPVVIPTDGPSLTALATETSALFEPQAVWWLDDLERFIDHLGGPELATLLEPGRTVVSTVREDYWHELLRTSGEDGERGRRLLAASRVILLPAQLSAEELARAERLYPRADFSSGLGEGLAAPDDGGVPVASAAGRPGRRGDPILPLVALTTFAAAVGLTAVIASGGFAVAKPPPITAQVDSIRAEAARAGKVTVLAFSETLHGVGAATRVFVLRSPHGGSDELRIYDEVDGWLRLRLDFQPRTNRSHQSKLSIAQPRDLQHGAYDYSLESPSVSDVFGNGERELIFDYAPRSSFLTVRLPIMVAWDDSTQRYQLSPLLDYSLPPPGAGVLPNPYLDRPYALSDTHTSAQLSAYAVSSFVVLPASGPATPILVTGAESGGGPSSRLAVNLYSLDATSGRAISKLMCGLNVTTLVNAPPTRGGDYASLLQRLGARLAPQMTGQANANGRGCSA